MINIVMNANKPASISFPTGPHVVIGSIGGSGSGQKGDKGDKGDPGDDGIGIKGDKGDPGDDGIGIKGDKGDPGDDAVIEGGTEGQLLVKTATDYGWISSPDHWVIETVGTGSPQTLLLPQSDLVPSQVLVSVAGLVKKPSTYNITGDELTLTATVAAEVVVISLNRLGGVLPIGDGAIPGLTPPTIYSSNAAARTLVAIPANPGSTGQWKKNGVDIAGATSTTLVLAASHLDAAITYVETLDTLTAASNILKPIRVMMTFGQSNDLGARNSLSELPVGYLATDPNFKIWKVATQTIETLVPGTMELQPGAGSVDPSYTNTVGPMGEFIKFFRTENASDVVVHAFHYVIGGGRFTDAGSLGRTANWLTSLNDGAWAGMKTEWDAYLSAANAQNIAPFVVQVNTALGYNSAENSTEGGNYQTNMGDLIAAIRTKMVGDTKVVIERMSNAAAGFTSRPALRTAQQNLVLADPTRMEMVNTDGAKIGTADAVHFDAATFIFTGEARFYHLTNKWYPEKDIQELGATLYPSAVYRAGDLRNTVSKFWDSSGKGHHLDQPTSGRQPTVVSNTLSNGVVARRAVFDAAGGGNSDVVFGGGAFALAQASGYGVMSAVKATTTGNAILIGESSSTTIEALGTHIMGNASGALSVIYRDVAGNIPAGMTFPTLIAGAFNGVTNFVAMTDSKTEVQGYVNGATGTALTYARGAGNYSTDRTSLGALQQQNNDPFLPMAATVGIIWYTNAKPDAAYVAKSRAFTQYRYGTV